MNVREKIISEGNSLRRQGRQRRNKLQKGGGIIFPNKKW
jgi:hypothetical protein